MSEKALAVELAKEREAHRELKEAVARLIGATGFAGFVDTSPAGVEALLDALSRVTIERPTEDFRSWVSKTFDGFGLARRIYELRRKAENLP